MSIFSRVRTALGKSDGSGTNALRGCAGKARSLVCGDHTGACVATNFAAGKYVGNASQVTGGFDITEVPHNWRDRFPVSSAMAIRHKGVVDCLNFGSVTFDGE